MLPQPLCPTSSHMSLQKPQRLPSKGDLGLVTQPQKQMGGRAALALTATPTDWKGARFVCCLPRSPGHKCPTVVPAMFPGSSGSCMASDSPTMSPRGLGTKLPPALPTLGLCMPWVAGNVARWHTGLTWDLTRGRKPSRRGLRVPYILWWVPGRQQLPGGGRMPWRCCAGSVSLVLLSRVRVTSLK